MKIKKKRRKSGQAVIEFLAVLGLYLFLLGFMFTGFQLMYSKTLLNISAFNGARYASLYQGDVAGAKRQAEDIYLLNVFSGTGDPKVEISKSGIYTTCKVSQNVKLLFPIMDPNSLTTTISEKSLSTQFTMRNERQSR